jgi:hypothetical protein
LNKREDLKDPEIKAAGENAYLPKLGLGPTTTKIVFASCMWR